jgi:hypothetical protein
LIFLLVNKSVNEIYTPRDLLSIEVFYRKYVIIYF